eukprot:scaffold6.g2598.t1
MQSRVEAGHRLVGAGRRPAAARASTLRAAGTRQRAQLPRGPQRVQAATEEHGPAAPALADARAPQQEPQPQPSTSGRPPEGGGDGGTGAGWVAQLKRAVRPLANLKLAIAELAVVAGLSAVGTVIEQGRPYAYYAAAYPEEGQKVLGFVTGRLIWALQWDHIYSADYFLLTMGLLGASLAACTWTNQWPAARGAQRWRWPADETALARLPLGGRLPGARLADLGRLLADKDYQVFLREGRLYAFKGLAGKLGPMGVHASMLAIMAGVALGAVGGWHGTLIVPEGGETLVGEALVPATPLARPPAGAAAVLHVDDFRIDYRTDGSVRQFFTDVTVRDVDGQSLATRTMLVNRPLRFGGVVAYQTDWSMAALTLRAEGSPLAPPGGGPFNLPMASLAGSGAGAGSDGKLYATFLPVEEGAPGAAPRGVSILARDLQSVVFYDSRGAFAGVRRPGSGKPLRVEGLDIVVEGIVGASGMELKSDPGVPLVYAGFGGLCITTVVSYLSHSQVWALQQGGAVLVGGRTNRAKLAFQQEVEELLQRVPDVAPPAPPLVDAAAATPRSGADGE